MGPHNDGRSVRRRRRVHRSFSLPRLPLPLFDFPRRGVSCSRSPSGGSASHWSSSTSPSRFRVAGRHALASALVSMSLLCHRLRLASVPRCFAPAPSLIIHPGQGREKEKCLGLSGSGLSAPMRIELMPCDAFRRDLTHQNLIG